MSNEIVVLSEVEAVRKNPGMYIGSVSDDGVHHLLQELVHNALDEAAMGSCSRIRVTLGGDHCEVEDDGRGIPTGIHPTEGVSSCEVALTRLHSGSKFSKAGNQFTAGLHGVGLSCVNALSSRLYVEIRRDGHRHEQEYRRGEALYPLRRAEAAERSGTLIRFWPDREIFKSFTRFEESRCRDFLEEQAFLNPGLELRLRSDSSGSEQVFQGKEGIAGLLRSMTAAARPLFPEPIELSFTSEKLRFRAALQWTAQPEPRIRSYVNCVKTVHGGTHVNAFRAGALRAVNRAARELGHGSWQGAALEMDEVMEGLFAVIDCKLAQPNFEGQTKGRLTNAEVSEPLERAVAESLHAFLRENPRVASVVLERIREVRNARIAAKRVAERIYFQHGDRKINEEVYKEQFGARSKNWHDSAVWITHEELLGKHAEMLKLGKEAVALDVCCGSGVVGAAFRPRVKKVFGLDLTPQMVKLASERLDEVRQGNVYEIPFPDESFDLVCTREVLHLLPYPEKPVSEIFRVLKPGGQFIVGQILPFGEDDAAWMYRVFKKKQPLIFNMFQEEDFRKLLTGAGFVDLEMKEINVWESIDVWINSYETTSLHRHEIRELFRNAPPEARAIHPFKILPSGEIHDLWRWCVFSVRKPGGAQSRDLAEKPRSRS